MTFDDPVSRVARAPIRVAFAVFAVVYTTGYLLLFRTAAGLFTELVTSVRALGSDRFVRERRAAIVVVLADQIGIITIAAITDAGARTFVTLIAGAPLFAMLAAARGMLTVPQSLRDLQAPRSAFEQRVGALARESTRCRFRASHTRRYDHRGPELHGTADARDLLFIHSDTRRTCRPRASCVRSLNTFEVASRRIREHVDHARGY